MKKRTSVAPWTSGPSRWAILAILAVFALPSMTPETAHGQSPDVLALSQVSPLEPGDRVRVQIWREPDLSGEFGVDESGSVVLPRLGSVRVWEIRTDSVARLLVNAYSTYIQDPAIEITPLRRIVVLGEVRAPGVVFVDPTMTLIDVLGQVGGIGTEGDRNRVNLIRDGRTYSWELSNALSLEAPQLHSGDQIMVPERHWISRNSALAGAMLTSAVIILTSVLTP